MADEYNNPLKQAAWDAYRDGYTLGKSVEHIDSVSISAARTEFESWWRVNAPRVRGEGDTEVFVDGTP